MAKLTLTKIDTGETVASNTIQGNKLTLTKNTQAATPTTSTPTVTHTAKPATQQTSTLPDLNTYTTGFEEPTTKEAVTNAKKFATGLGGAILGGADIAATGISSTANWLLGRPLQALGWQNNPISALDTRLKSDQQANAQNLANALEAQGTSEAGKKAVDLGKNVVAALPQAVIAYMTAGLSTAAQGTSAGLQAASASAASTGGLANTIKTGIQTMLKSPNYWTAFAQTAGTNYDQAKADGASDAKATAFATVNGLLNALVEVGGGGIQKLPTALKSGNASAIRQWVDTMLDEGKEEVVQGVIERLAQNVTYNKGNPLASVTNPNAVFNPVTSAKEGAMGSLVGGILGGGQIMASKALTPKARVNTPTAQTTAETAPQTQTAPVMPQTQNPVQAPTIAQGATQTNPVTYTENALKSNTAQQGKAQNTNAPLQLNINNAIANPNNGRYNIENGGNVDGYTGTAQDTRNGISGEQHNLGADALGGQDRRGNIELSGQSVIPSNLRNKLTASGVVDLGLQDSSGNGAVFVGALTTARDADAKNGWAVSPQTEESLKADGTKAYLAADGLAGIGVKNDGDITAAFKNPGSKKKLAIRDLMATALSNGGNKCDCYGSDLVKAYVQQGFIPVARTKFDPQYANPGWDESKGQPDIYFMMHNGDSVDTVASRYNSYPTYSQADLEALPLMEYQDAYAYRDGMITSRGAQSPQSNGIFPQGSLGAKITGELPSGVGAMSNPFPTARKVSEVYTNTLKNTDLLNDVQKAQLDERDYTFDSVGEKQSVAVAQQRLEADFDGEVADLSAKPAYTAAEDVDTAMGILGAFAADGESKGDFTAMKQWSKDLYSKIHQSAVTLQAMDKYSRTPEGAVIKAQQTVDEVEKKLTTKKENGKSISNKRGRAIKEDTGKVKSAMDESAKEASQVVQSISPADFQAATDLIGEIYNLLQPQSTDTAAEWWIRDTAKKLASTINQNAGSKAGKTDETTMQAVLKDLVKLTKEAAPQSIAAKTASKSATNTLRNYWANPAEYDSAVQRAQRYISEKYSNNPDMLAVFNDWLSGSGVNTWGLIGRALKENGVKYNDILMSSWRDKAQLLDNVTKAIISDTDMTQEQASKAAQSISDKFYDELVTRAQNKIESLMKLRTRSQRKTALQAIDQFMNAGVFDDSAVADLVRAKYGIPTLTTADIQKVYELNKLAQETTNDYQKRVFINRAARLIADKLPVKAGSKILAGRRMAMLLNPKTLISRNAGGNIIFGLLEDIKDATGTGIDMLVSTKTGRRTTSYNPFATSKAEFLGAKKGLTEWVKDIKNGVDTSPTQHEMPRSTALKSKFGAGAETVLYKLLALGDRPFFEAAYSKRIDESKRLGLDYTSDDAVAEATTYALERVFQNNSVLAQKAMELRESLGVLGDIAIPFAQTPANIIDKVLDYSPYGIKRAIQKAGTIKDSAWSQKQFVDTLARSLTGTGIIALGAVGFLAGFITGGEDDNEDEALTYQKKISGWQPYSINFGDKSYTYDWANPVGTLLALGADIAQSGSLKDTLSAILMAGLKAGINTMFSQSYLEGLSEIFGQDDIASGLETMLINLPASFTPTAFQQIARLIDPIARDTYDTDPFKRAWNKVIAKIPWASKSLPAKIGASGKEVTNFGGSTGSNILESLLSPGYIGETTTTKVDNEVQRLYEATGETSVFPEWSEYTSKSDFSLNANGEKYTMTAAEWETYQKTRGTTAYQLISSVLNTAAYRNLSNAEKANLISDINSYANDTAKRNILKARGETYSSSWDAEAAVSRESGIPVTTYLIYENAVSGLTADKDEDGNSISGSKKNKVVDYIASLNLTDKQKDYLYLSEGYAESTLSDAPWHTD